MAYVFDVLEIVVEVIEAEEIVQLANLCRRVDRERFVLNNEHVIPRARHDVVAADRALADHALRLQEQVGPSQQRFLDRISGQVKH